jgi:hypothetical protein
MGLTDGAGAGSVARLRSARLYSMSLQTDLEIALRGSPAGVVVDADLGASSRLSLTSYLVGGFRRG